MESYILRIYRYQPLNPGRLVGVLQKSESEPQLAFTTLEELWELIQQTSTDLSPDSSMETK